MPLTFSLKPPLIRGDGLKTAYHGVTVFDGLDIALPHGAIIALVGPNGSGKSTLLKTLARLLRPDSGQVWLGDDDMAQLSHRQIARRLALLPQGAVAPEGLTVRELISYGRFPWQSWSGNLQADDHRVIEEAIAMTGLQSLEHHLVEQLSGGQRQRVWIAMTVAQQTDCLLLDEPTTYLDIAHQLEILHLLQHLNQQYGRTIIMVLHDINLAARYASQIIALKDGNIVARGTPEEIITPQTLLEVFGIQAQIVRDNLTGRPWCIPQQLATSPEGVR